MYVRSHRLWTLDLRAVPWRRARLVAKEGYLLPVPPFNNDDVVCLLARFVDGPVRPGLVTTRLPWAGGEQTNGRQTIRQTSKRRTITYHPKHTHVLLFLLSRLFVLCYFQPALVPETGKRQKVAHPFFFPLPSSSPASALF